MIERNKLLEADEEARFLEEVLTLNTLWGMLEDIQALIRATIYLTHPRVVRHD